MMSAVLSRGTAGLSFVLLTLSLCFGSAIALTDSNGSFPADELIALNKAVNGRLYRGTPVSLPCFASYDGQPNVVSNASCAVVQAGYIVPEFRVQQFGAYMQVREAFLLDYST